MRPLHCLETSGTIYHVVRRQITEELLRTPNILHGTIIVHVTTCLRRWRFCVCVCVLFAVCVNILLVVL